jgi:hypothetical protein
MAAAHFELLVEEPSMEAFLSALLPRLLPQDRTFVVHPFQGKRDLIGKLEQRLRGYASWLPADWRVVVVVDRDNEDCLALKRQLERISERAGLVTRTRAAGAAWQLVNRIAIEELVYRSCLALDAMDYKGYLSLCDDSLCSSSTKKVAMSRRLSTRET